MTRINCIPPSELTDKHLLAEYRESIRIYGWARKAWDRGDDPASFPDTYRLGKGHVTFFYAKLGYVRRRRAALCAEMVARGFEVNYELPDANLDMPDDWQGDWEPDATAMALNRQRIAERNGHAA